MYHDIDIIVSTTLPTIDKLMGYKNGWDALLLYFRYVKQSRIQETNVTYSKDEFMIKAMKWGKQKFYNAKWLLTTLWLIEVVERRRENWQLDGKYVKVNFIITQTADNPEGGESDANAWSNKKENTWSNKYKYDWKEYKKKEAIDYIYENYTARVPKDKKKYIKSAQTKLYIEQLLKEFSLRELIDSANTYFRKTDKTYIMAPQYFYSNTKAGKQYRVFVDYISEEKKKIIVDTNLF